MGTVTISPSLTRGQEQEACFPFVKHGDPMVGTPGVKELRECNDQVNVFPVSMV